MSRTFRRTGANSQAGLGWALRWAAIEACHAPLYMGYEPLRVGSHEWKRTVARFRSDARTERGPSRTYRRMYNHFQRTHNDRELRRAVADPQYDAIFDVRHRNRARWGWF